MSPNHQLVFVIFPLVQSQTHFVNFGKYAQHTTYSCTTCGREWAYYHVVHSNIVILQYANLLAFCTMPRLNVPEFNVSHVVRILGDLGSFSDRNFFCLMKTSLLF